MPLSFAVAAASRNRSKEAGAMKRCLMTMCLVFLAVSAALAQEKKTVPPPPKPADDGPSLEVTMKFIQDKLGEQGTFNFVLAVHAPREDKDWSVRMMQEASSVRADAAACGILYHYRSAVNGASTADTDLGINLKDVKDLTVLTGEQNQSNNDTDAGNPGRSYSITPEFYVLRVRRGNLFNRFNFHEEEMANRVAKAMVHAVELCGGGSKDPF